MNQTPATTLNLQTPSLRGPKARGNPGLFLTAARPPVILEERKRLVIFPLEGIFMRALRRGEQKDVVETFCFLLAIVKKLTGRSGYRLRVGDWRVIHELVPRQSGEDVVPTIRVLMVAPRGGVYQ